MTCSTCGRVLPGTEWLDAPALCREHSTGEPTLGDLVRAIAGANLPKVQGKAQITLVRSARSLAVRAAREEMGE